MACWSGRSARLCGSERSSTRWSGLNRRSSSWSRPTVARRLRLRGGSSSSPCRSGRCRSRWLGLRSRIFSARAHGDGTSGCGCPARWKRPEAGLAGFRQGGDRARADGVGQGARFPRSPPDLWTVGERGGCGCGDHAVRPASPRPEGTEAGRGDPGICGECRGRCARGGRRGCGAGQSARDGAAAGARSGSGI